jgi:tetratricopeptide (TPR) repeat protein
MIPKVFVSFSGRDTKVIARLLIALNRYRVSVWDYTREGTRIPFGANISDYCKLQIEEAQYFFAFISCNTVSSEFGGYAQEETRHALQLRKTSRSDLVIVPVVDSSAPFPTICPPYDQLSGVLRLEFDSSLDTSIDNVVRTFCVETVGIDAVPTFHADPRIRFIEHFRLEYRDFEATHKGSGPEYLSRAGEIRLDQLTEEFSEVASRPKADWDEALTVIQEIHRTLKKRNLAEEFYFLHPMRGLCYFELGDYSRAMSAFDAAIAHKKADAHAFAGRALVAARIGNQEAALRDLVRAESFAGVVIPWEIRFNITCLLLASEQPVELDEVLLRVNADLLELDDWAKFKTMLGVYYFRRNALVEAETVLRAVVDRKVEGRVIADDNAVAWYAEVLSSRGKSGLAAQMLVCEASERNSPDLLYRAAYLYLDMKRVRKALEVFESLCKGTPVMKIQYLVGYMRLLRKVGELRKCILISEKIVAIIEERTSMNAEDHFYLGYCHYIRGNTELAGYEHKLGRSFSQTPFDQL